MLSPSISPTKEESEHFRKIARDQQAEAVKWRVHCCELSGDVVCGLCQESMKRNNTRLMSLLEAANAKLEGGEALNRRSSEVYRLVSSSFVRKLMDPDCPEDGKRRKMTGPSEEWSKQDEDSFIDDMKEQQLNLERLATDAFTDPELAVGDGCVTPPDQVDIHSSNSGSPKDVSPEMSAAEVVKSIGAMCSEDQKAERKQARKESQVRKRLDDQDKVPVKKALNYKWAIPAILKGLGGDMRALNKKDPRVSEYFKLLMNDVEEGVMVVVHVQNHWFLVAKIDDQIRSRDVQRNGFCAFSCAFWIWRWSQKWDVDKPQKRSSARSRTPGLKEEADEHQAKGVTKPMTPQQETWATVEAIGMTSFAYVMSVESMSQCIFESEAKEGVTESHEHTRL